MNFGSGRWQPLGSLLSVGAYVLGPISHCRQSLLTLYMTYRYTEEVAQDIYMR